jgi:hypothetical protein
VENKNTANQPYPNGVATTPAGNGRFPNQPESVIFGAPPGVPQPSVPSQQPQSGRRLRTPLILTSLIVLVLVGGMLWLLLLISQREAEIKSAVNKFENTQLQLDGLANNKFTSANELTISGKLTIDGGLVLTPSDQPTDPQPGQLYYDQVTDRLSYFDGTQFIVLEEQGQVEESPPDTGTTIITTGVLSFQGLTGNIALTAGSGIAINGTTISATGGNPGTLAVNQGGTGTTSHTTNGVLIGQGTGALTTVAAGAAGQCLLSTAGAPTFAACPSAGGSLFAQNGNSFGATAVLGTNDTNGLSFEVDDTIVASLSSTGAANFINVTNSTQAFNIESESGGNLFTVDTTNGRIGINLGSNNVPNVTTSGIELQGALRISGNSTSLRDTYTSPDGADISVNFSVVTQNISDFGQVIAVGVDSASSADARGIVAFDDRAVDHQPTIAVFSPNENNVFGLSWEGSSDEAYIKTHGVDDADITLRIDTTDSATFSEAAVTLLQDSTVSAGSTTTAFRVVNGGVPLFVVDTSNSRVYIGDPTADTTGALLVLDHKTDAGDPTGVDGGMYYNENLASFRCHEDGYWRNCTESSRSTYHVKSDFPDQVDDNDFSFSTSGGLLSHVGAVSGHPGILEQSTAGSTTGLATILGSDANDDVLLLGNGDTWRYETVVRVPTLSAAGDPFTVRAGFLDASATDGTDGCYFKYSDDVNGGEWQGLCIDNGGGNITTCDSNVAVVAATWYRLTVAVNAAGSLADFRINGSSACTVAADIPTGAGRSTTYGNAVVKDGSGTNARTLQTDYIEVLGQLGSAR